MVTAIHEQIKILVELQKLDAEIYQLKKELAENPVLQKKLEQEFEKKAAALKAAEVQLKGLQAKQKEREMDLQGKEEKIKKLQSQLYQLKSNKEYAAMEHEIKGMKADKSLLEEEILGLLDAVDAGRAKAAAEKERLATEEKTFREAETLLKKKTAEAAAAAAALEEKRKVFLPGIEARLLGQYEKVLKSRAGSALVPVRNNSCGGCHMEFPPQVVNEIQMQDKLVICESCARIVYWPS